MTYDNCVKTVSNTLKRRGREDHEEVAADMCNMWADQNGVEREFGNQVSTKPVQRSFALSVGENEDITFSNNDGIETVQFPVIAITSGIHEYEADDMKQKVYIEPNILKTNIEAFKELPIYFNHQRTPEDLIGMATEPEAFEMENGKTGVKMAARVTNNNKHGQEVMDKVKDGDITHVSIDWFSNDVDVMGDTYATKIRPTEVSFIDNEVMEPVCKECTIETKCGLHVPEEDHDCGCGGHDDGACKCEDGKQEVVNMTEETTVKSDAENIVEREFASLRSQLEEVTASKDEMAAQYEAALKSLEEYKAAEEARLAEEAEARKVEAVEAIISKEVILGTLEETAKETRSTELNAWDESRLTGFSEALAAMPVPEETERTFGKGKANEGEAVPQETERQFAVKMDENGMVKLNRELLKNMGD